MTRPSLAVLFASTERARDSRGVWRPVTLTFLCLCWLGWQFIFQGDLHAQDAPVAIPVPRELVESALNAQREFNTWAAIARYTRGQLDEYCKRRGMTIRQDGQWCDPAVKESGK